MVVDMVHVCVPTFIKNVLFLIFKMDTSYRVRHLFLQEEYFLHSGVVFILQ